VKNILEHIGRLIDKNSIENDVDEELRFHIDMQTGDYERRGLSSDESRLMAENRFGNVERIRKECLRISTRSSVLIWILNSVFMLFFIVGMCLRFSVAEVHFHRVGVVMMMIGGLGVLLVYAKQAGTTLFNDNSNPLKLGLRTYTPPRSFDEQGRTPFDRVRTDD